MLPGPVADLNAFVPARDFDLSQRFYLDLGFTRLWGNSDIAQFEAGDFRFLLQNFYVPAHAENFMMSLAVDDADVWWQHIQEHDLQRKYGLFVAKARQYNRGAYGCSTCRTRAASSGTSPTIGFDSDGRRRGKAVFGVVAH